MALSIFPWSYVAADMHYRFMFIGWVGFIAAIASDWSPSFTGAMNVNAPVLLGKSIENASSYKA
jgi:hypothetical protein